MAELHKHHVDNVGNPGRDVTTVRVLDLDLQGEETELLLGDLLSDLAAAYETIPEPFRDRAVVSFKGYGEYVSISGEVEFKRPETDEEFAARKAWLAGNDAESEARDRAEFQRLSRKFGNP